MIAFLRRHWPIFLALGAFWIALTVIAIQSLVRTQGHLGYVLDDPYIHMAMANNFSQYGVWGITKYSFSSSSSSPLWILLLSLAYILSGPSEIAPFVLNVLFATLLCIVSYLFFRQHLPNPYVVLAAMLLLIISAPLSALVFTGEEHILQTLLTIALVCFSVGLLSTEGSGRMRSLVPLGLAPLVTSTRYEGLLLILVLAVLFARRGKKLYSICLVALGVVPVAAYGAVSMAQGWYLLPNSVLLKAQVPNPLSATTFITSLTSGFHNALTSAPHMIALVAAVLAVLWFQQVRQRDTSANQSFMLLVLLGTTVLHLGLAKLGSFFRYEAYLVTLGVLVLTVSLHNQLRVALCAGIDLKRLRQRAPLLVIVSLALLLLLTRGVISIQRTPIAMQNIFEQQYQMGLFLKEFYQGQPIAANDIGAISYLGDTQLLDLAGLGSMEVATAAREDRLGRQIMDEMTKAKGIRIAILYDRWFQSWTDQWLLVGQWKIKDNVIAGDDTVSFYAVNASEASKLAASLKTFSPRLPGGVLQIGAYTN